MREIKYRVWDKNEKKMHRVQSIDFVSQQCWIDPALCSYSLGYVPIMQFIGVLDSKGREIYDGDIVRVPGNLIMYRTHNASVEWSDTELGWCTSSGLKITNHSPDSVKTLEIIGNVHENPELLVVNA